MYFVRAYADFIFYFPVSHEVYDLLELLRVRDVFQFLFSRGVLPLLAQPRLLAMSYSDVRTTVTATEA